MLRDASALSTTPGRIGLGCHVLDLELGELLDAHGRPAQLRAQALKVLLALGEHCGEVVGKDELMRRVWGDVVVTDTFVSMSDKDAAKRLKDLAPFKVSEDLMSRANGEALFLHCLPAHRGEEVDAEVIDGPRSLVFDEAENRLHAQKAILEWCLLG